MSSRLLSMKFMQRKAKDGSSSGTEAAKIEPKKKTAKDSSEAAAVSSSLESDQWHIETDFVKSILAKSTSSLNLNSDTVQVTNNRYMFLNSDISHGRISFSSSPIKIKDDDYSSESDATNEDKAPYESKITKEEEVSTPKISKNRTKHQKEASDSNSVPKKEKKRKLPKFVNNSSSNTTSSNSFKKPKPSIFDNKH